MVGAAHDEFHAAGDGTEFPDGQMVPELRPVEEDVVPLKGRGVHGIAVIGVVPHGDVGGGNHIF